MEAERWEKVSELFYMACERPVEGQTVFLAEACAGDAELRREVESLLRQHVSRDGPLERVAQVGQPSKDCAFSITVPRA